MYTKWLQCVKMWVNSTAVIENVFHYSQPREFLVSFLAEKKKKNPRFSIRSWSRVLGYKNPSVLAKILKGERRLKSDLARKIAESMGLEQNEKAYFEALVLISNAKGEAEKNIYKDLLGSKLPPAQIENLSLDYFRVIADWYHLVILEMFGLKNFNADPTAVAKRLGKKISSAEADLALSRLERLELICRDSKNKRVRNKGRLFIGKNVPSEAIRKFHRQMIQRSLDELDLQTLDERSVMGTTLAIRAKDIPKFQALIDKFHSEVQASGKSSDGDAVYQFNTQFFRLTEKENIP